MYVMRRIENSTICLQNLDFYLMKFKKKESKQDKQIILTVCGEQAKLNWYPTPPSVSYVCLLTR